MKFTKHPPFVDGLSQEDMEKWHINRTTDTNSPLMRNGAVRNIQPHFVSCDFEEGELVFSFPVLKWQMNPQQMVHGGIISTCFDTTLGVVCHYYAQPYPLVTVQLSTSFLKPVPKGETMVFRAKITSFGRSLVTVEGEAYLESTHEIAATSSAIFKILRPASKEKGKEEKGKEKGREV